MENVFGKLLKLGLVIASLSEVICTPQHKEQAAIEGTSYKMKCTDPVHDPSILKATIMQTIVIWSVNGTIPQSPKYKMLTDGLVIRNVSRDDTFGNYTCTVLDRFTFTPIHSANITLKIRQRTGKFFESKNIPGSAATERKVQVWGIMNQWVKLQCNMFARPSPTFEWKKVESEEKIKTLSNVYKILEDESTSNLTIFLQNDTLFGEYICKASNNLGESIQHFILTEGYKPKSPFIYPTYIGKDRLTIKVEPQEVFRTDLTAYKVALPVTNYLIQYIEAEGLSLPTGAFSAGSRFHSRNKKWTTVTMSAGDKTEKSPYIARHERGVFELRNLKGNTTYMIRCAVTNSAAVSDFSPAIRITTDAYLYEATTAKDQNSFEDTMGPSREEYGRSSNYGLTNETLSVPNENPTPHNNCSTPKYKKTLLRTITLTTTIEDLTSTNGNSLDESSSLVKKRVEEDTSVERIFLCSI